MKVSIQGQPGSFHDVAAKHYFGSDYKPLSRSSFGDVFRDVAGGHTDYALIVIENSLFGSLNQVYDELLGHENLWICGEIYLRINLCLVGFKKARLESLREVHSHPTALAQAEEFLDHEMPYVERFANHDTAGSVAQIKKWNDPTKAAIASKEAAQLHGMEILREGIETHHENYTRFIVLTQSKVVPPDAAKTSLILLNLGKEPNSNVQPGLLYKRLGCFAERDISLSKVESRVVVGKAWRRIFYLDFDESLGNTKANEALTCIEDQGSDIRILGSYKPGEHID